MACIEEDLATHSSVLAWRIPWTEEPGGLQSMGSQRVGHDESNLHACVHTWIVLLVFFPVPCMCACQVASVVSDPL